MRTFRRSLSNPERTDLEQPRVWATCSSEALCHNYDVLSHLAEGQVLLPMIKANAYGHGMGWAAKTLEAHAGKKNLYGFGVATLEEGRDLRQALGLKHRKRRILVFSGACVFSEEIGQFCEDHGLSPVLTNDADWEFFYKHGWCERLSYDLKFNTGMNRLGLSMGHLERVLSNLKTLKPEHRPQSVLSHFAQSEQPESRLTLQQLDRWDDIQKRFKSVAPELLFHLGNSGAIWNHKKLGLDHRTDLVRPGLSLYGIRPWAEAGSKNLQPVLRLEARVGQVRPLRAGESVGYGGRYTVASGENHFAATLLAGYADGIHRTLSQAGSVWLGDRKQPILGSISMDLISVKCAETTRPGDTAVLIGSELDLWEQAHHAKTIPYELLTSLSSRVQRRYI